MPKCVVDITAFIVIVHQSVSFFRPYHRTFCNVLNVYSQKVAANHIWLLSI